MPRQEASDLRIRGAKLVQQFVDQKVSEKANGIPIKGNEPKMAKRGLRSLMLTPHRYSDLLEKALSEGWDGERLKNALRGLMEKEFPKTQKVLNTDRIHHASAPDMWTKVIDRAMKSGNPELIIDAVDQAYEEGLKLGDTHESTAGASFDERAHTGARPKQSKDPTKYIAPGEHGVDGQKEFSAHPRGTKADGQLVITDKSYDTSKDLLEEARPKIALANQDTLRGVKADQTRRNFINSNSVEQGWIPKGTDVFGKNVTPEHVRAVRDGFSKNVDLTIGAAKAFNPKAYFMNGLGGAAGLMLDADAAKKFAEGDYIGAIKTGAGSAAFGEVASQVIQRVSPHVAKLFAGVVPKVAPYVAPVAKVANPIGQAVVGTQVANELVKAGTGEGFIKKVQNVQDKQRTADINAQRLETTQQLAVKRKQTGQDQSFADNVTNVIAKGANDLTYAIKNPLSIFGIK